MTAPLVAMYPKDAPRGTGDTGGQFVAQGSPPAKAAPAKAQPKAAPAAKPKPKPAAQKPAAKPTTPGKPGSARLNLKMGAKNNPAEVRNLQALLSDLKVASVAVDGQFGQSTESAVKAAQAKLGMKPTGRASSSFIRRLADAHALSPCIGKVAAGAIAAAVGEPDAVDAAEHSGAMIALVPSDEDLQRLETDDGEPADEMHCTLVYLGNAADFNPEQRARLVLAVTSAVADLGPVEADGFAVNMFNPNGDDPCVVLGLSGADLATAKGAVDDAVAGIDLPDQHEPWIPHVTLEYTDDPSVVSEYVDQTGPIEFDRVRVAFGDQTTDIPLDRTGSVLAAAGADVTPGHDQLHHYWVAGPGLAKWAGSPTPWTTLVTNLVEEGVSPDKAKVYASRWFIEHFGFAAGSDKNRVAHGHAPRGDVVGPG